MEDRVALERTDRSHRQVVARSDVRWLLVWLAVFVAAVLGLLAAHQVYRMTGPHPQVTVLIRKLKHHARWLIPGQKGRRSELAPLPMAPPPPHYAGSSSTSGQVAQRAKT